MLELNSVKHHEHKYYVVSIINQVKEFKYWNEQIFRELLYFSFFSMATHEEKWHIQCKRTNDKRKETKYKKVKERRTRRTDYDVQV